MQRLVSVLMLAAIGCDGDLAALDHLAVVEGERTVQSGDPCSTIVGVGVAEEGKGPMSVGNTLTAYPYALKNYISASEGWCTGYVAWVYKAAGYPFTGGSQGGWMLKGRDQMRQWFQNKNTYVGNGSSSWSSFTPEGGDLLFFPGHVGLVQRIQGTTLITIEGNVNNKVMSRSFSSWRGRSDILGVGRRMLGCGDTSPTPPAPSPPSPPPSPPSPPSPTPPTPNPDLEPPRVTITYPPSGASVDRSFTLRALIEDKGATQVELAVDGKARQTLAKPPFDFPLVLEPGEHTLQVRAEDASRNSGQASVRVTVQGAASGDLALGEPCLAGPECASGLCVRDNDRGEQYCAQRCTPGGNACGASESCVPVGGLGICAPSAGNGARATDELTGTCAVGSGTVDTVEVTALWLALALGWWSRRRRLGQSSSDDDGGRSGPARGAGARGAPPGLR